MLWPNLTSIRVSYKLLVFGLLVVFLAILTLVLFITPSLPKPSKKQPPLALNYLQDLIPLSPSSVSHRNDVQKQSETTLVVTGDVLLAREVNYQALQKKDFQWPWYMTADILRQADIALINLETPLVQDCPVTRSGMIFCGDPQNVTGLSWSGIDVASLANNHALNHGVEGVEQTTRFLEDINVLPSGVLREGQTHQTPTIVERNGITFAFLSYTDLGVTAGAIAKSEPEVIKNDIELAQQQADVVIPFFHWGEEYQSQPTARQTLLAHVAIEAGADLVIGNHPHWYQALEIYQGVPIAYSHGNFIFDQMWSMETRLGMVGRYTFSDKTLSKIEFVPIQIEDYGQPFFLEGQEKHDQLKKLESISQKLQPEFTQNLIENNLDFTRGE